jgi:hypothetical protein
MNRVACIVLTDNDLNIDFKAFFYEALEAAGGELSLTDLAQQASRRFPFHPFRERLIDDADFLDFDSMKSTGLIPVVHYYPITEGKVTSACRHFYSKRDLRMQAFGMTSKWSDQNPNHLRLNRRAFDTTPSYFRSTVSMIHSAFPDGLPLEHYLPLLYLFRRQGWSYQGVAHAIENCFEIRHSRALDDAYGTENLEIPPDKVERLRQHLASHGLQEWEEDEHDAAT